MATDTVRERFFKKFTVSDCGCWVWSGASTKFGYGVMGGPNRTVLYAHRVSHEIHKGEIPTGFVVMHKCDNPKCVNPDHLCVGTHAENIKDCIAKGRSSRGEKNGMARITRLQVDEMRKRVLCGERQCDVAKEYGISKSHISSICNGRRW